MIWAVNPLFMAVADYLIYSQNLRWFHLVGTVSIVACAVLLSLANVIDPIKPKGNEVKKAEVSINPKLKKGSALPSWIPVIFGVLTPVFFTTSGILTKHLTGTRREGEPLPSKEEKDRFFDASNISFSSYIVVNIVILCAAIPYWHYVHFSS